MVACVFCEPPGTDQQLASRIKITLTSAQYHYNTAPPKYKLGGCVLFFTSEVTFEIEAVFMHTHRRFLGTSVDACLLAREPVHQIATGLVTLETIPILARLASDTVDAENPA